MSRRFAKLLTLFKPKRRWLQFSMGTMLLAVTALCVWLADYVSPVRRLERQLGDPDEELRELAAERLGYIGREFGSCQLFRSHLISFFSHSARAVLVAFRDLPRPPRTW